MTHGRITFKGTATDDAAVKAAYVSIQNRTTGRWLTAKSAWSATYQRLPVTLAKPNTRSTTWSLAFTVPAGKVIASLVVVDSKAVLNATPRPGLALTLR
jgi:hypothetical protein